MKTKFALISLLFFSAILLSGCGSPQPAPGPERDFSGMAKNELGGKGAIWVAYGWQNPQLLGEPVNSLGWEDGAYITSDGSTLYFAYFQGDLVNFILNGAKDFEKYKRGPSREVNPPGTIDAFYSEKTGSTWGEPKKFKYDEDLWSEGGVMISGNEIYYMSNKPEGFGNDDIYLDGTNIGAPVNTKYDEEDPHFSGGELFFWSEQRPKGTGKKNIWMSENANGRWSEPLALSAPINMANTESMQPFLAENGILYFTSNRDGVPSIYRSERLGKNKWSDPEKVIAPDIVPDKGAAIVAVGEPTLTADGSYLYFVVISRGEKGGFDSDIAYAWKK